MAPHTLAVLAVEASAKVTGATPVSSPAAFARHLMVLTEAGVDRVTFLTRKPQGWRSATLPAGRRPAPAGRRRPGDGTGSGEGRRAPAGAGRCRREDRGGRHPLGGLPFVFIVSVRSVVPGPS